MAIDTSPGGIYSIGSINYNSVYSGYVDIIVNSINVAANTSNITVRWVYKKNKSDPWGAWNGGSSTKVTLRYNGTSNTAVAPFDLRNAAVGAAQILHSVTLDIPHNADGTKSINVGGTHVTNLNPPGWGTVTVPDNTVNLPTIPRASSIGSMTPSVTAGGSVTVNINRASASFTHTVVFAFGAYSQSFTGVATSQAYAIPLAWCNAIPSGISGGGSVTVTTYNGGTQIGSPVSAGFTVYAPASMMPTVSSFTATRIDNGVPAAWGIYVQGKSRVKLTAAASGVYGSAITGYTISGDGYSGGGNVLETGVINNAGTVSYTVTATDSRGRTATKTTSISVQPYAPPQVLNTTECGRCTSNGALSDSGTYLHIMPKGAFSACGGKNPLALKVRYMPTGGSWSGYTGLTNGSAAVIGGGSINVDKTYTVEISATDQFHTITAIYSVGTSKSVISLLSSGNGVAFGKSAEAEGIAEFAWPVRLSKGQLPNHITDPLDVSLNNGIYLYNSNHTGSINNPMKPLACVGICEIRKYDGNNVYVRLTVTAERTVYEAYYRSWMGGWGEGWVLAESFAPIPTRSYRGSFFNKESGGYWSEQTVVMTKIHNDIWRGHIYGDFSDWDIDSGAECYNYGVDMQAIARTLGYNNYCSYTMDNGVGNGHWDIWDSSNRAKVGGERTELGAVFQPMGSRWLTPARIYTTAGNVGSWATNKFPRVFFINAEFYMRMW